MLTLDEVKQFLRIEHASDDAFLSSLITAAVEYMTAAGITSKESELYKLACKLFISMMYEGQEDRVTVSLRNIMLQLKAGEGL